ncbi:MAG: CpaE family protein [Bryobacteraceae bacterium]
MQSRGENPGWRPLIICADSGLAQGLAGAMRELCLEEAARFSSYPSRAVATQMVTDKKCDVCLLDVATSPEIAMPLVAGMAEVVPVVAMHTAHDPEAILRCLRRGAGEFLFEPLTAEQLSTVLERLAKLRGPRKKRRLGTCYCVVPGKPGSGATTMAAHLAAEVARRGSGRVLLADLDLFSGSVGFQLKLKGEFTAADVFAQAHAMDAELWRRLAVPWRNLDVLLAPETPLRQSPSPEAVAAVLTFWRENYDVMVLDSAGAHCDLALAAARLAENVLAAATDGLEALHATRRSLDWLERQGVERGRIRLVVRHVPGGLGEGAVRAALGREIFFTAADDPAGAREALLEGGLAVPGSRLARSAAGLAACLAGVSPAPERSRPSLAASLFSLLRKPAVSPAKIG